jgi:hypothetical protein
MGSDSRPTDLDLSPATRRIFLPRRGGRLRGAAAPPLARRECGPSRASRNHLYFTRRPLGRKPRSVSGAAAVLPNAISPKCLSPSWPGDLRVLPGLWPFEFSQDRSRRRVRVANRDSPGTSVAVSANLPAAQAQQVCLGGIVLCTSKPPTVRFIAVPATGCLHGVWRHSSTCHNDSLNAEFVERIIYHVFNY